MLTLVVLHIARLECDVIKDRSLIVLL